MRGRVESKLRTVRLVKYLAHSGVASRRKAEEIIAEGRVSVDGAVVKDPALDVEQDDAVKVDGKLVGVERREYYLLNKPAGVVSTADDPQGRTKVVDMVRAEGRVYPVGRLDAGSTGLMLLTNDGELANRLMHPRYGVEKTYSVKVKGRISNQATEKLSRGVEIDGGRTAPAKVKPKKRSSGSSRFEITIREGRNRQVRKMCQAVGHDVLELKRTQFGPLTLKGLEPGQSRVATTDEIRQLKQ